MKKVSLFIIFITFVNFSALSQVAEIANKLRQNEPYLIKKSRQLFFRKIKWYEKKELKKKFGEHVLDSLTFYPAFTQMILPKNTKIDTINFYNNFKYFKIAKKRGFHTTYIIYKKNVLGALTRVVLNDDKIFLDFSYWDEKAYDKTNYNSIKEVEPALHFHVKNTGLGIMFIKNDSLLTTESIKEDGKWVEKIMTLDESLKVRDVKDWKILFWVNK